MNFHSESYNDVMRYLYPEQLDPWELLENEVRLRTTAEEEAHEALVDLEYLQEHMDQDTAEMIDRLRRYEGARI